MKSTLALALLAAAPSLAAITPAPPVPADVNPFLGKAFLPSPVYAKEVAGEVASQLKAGHVALAAKSAQLALVSSFVWISSFANISLIKRTFLFWPARERRLTARAATLQDALKLQKATGRPQIAQFVVYDLPDRDCSAGASAGEYSVANNGLANYKNYIDNLKAAIDAVPGVSVVLIIEPDSIGNIVTNLNVPKVGGRSHGL
jgi:cellulose 1,4-beta-cellobiosidase